MMPERNSIFGFKSGPIYIYGGNSKGRIAGLQTNRMEQMVDIIVSPPKRKNILFLAFAANS
jgi:hypothetical protein